MRPKVVLKPIEGQIVFYSVSAAIGQITVNNFVYADRPTQQLIAYVGIAHIEMNPRNVFEDKRVSQKGITMVIESKRVEYIRGITRRHSESNPVPLDSEVVDHREPLKNMRDCRTSMCRIWNVQVKRVSPIIVTRRIASVGRSVLNVESSKTHRTLL